MILLNILLHSALSIFIMYVAVVALNDRRKSTANFGLVMLSLFYNELKILADNLAKLDPGLSFLPGVFFWSYNTCIILSVVSIISSRLIPNLLKWGGQNAIYTQLKIRSTRLKILTDKYNLERDVSSCIINDIEDVNNHA